MWFIGIKVEQETSAAPPKKILDPSLSEHLQALVRHTGNTYKRKVKYIFRKKMNQNTFGGLKKLARRFK